MGRLSEIKEAWEGESWISKNVYLILLDMIDRKNKILSYYADENIYSIEPNKSRCSIFKDKGQLARKELKGE